MKPTLNFLFLVFVMVRTLCAQDEGLHVGAAAGYGTGGGFSTIIKDPHYHVQVIGLYAFDRFYGMGVSGNYDVESRTVFTGNNTVEQVLLYRAGLNFLYRQNKYMVDEQLSFFTEITGGPEFSLLRTSQDVSRGTGFRFAIRPGISLVLTDYIRAELRFGEVTAGLTRFISTQPSGSVFNSDFDVVARFRPGYWRIGILYSL